VDKEGKLSVVKKEDVNKALADEFVIQQVIYDKKD